MVNPMDSSSPMSTAPSAPSSPSAPADLDTPELVLTLAGLLQARGWMLATAESCTGGLIGAACTEVAGSSAWFERGFITYSNEAKTELLGVDAAVIAAHGAVSEPVARAMATGAVARSAPARVALAVTGVAGPTGGTPDKPVGTVWFGWSVDGAVRTERRRFDGDRATVRAATVLHALHTLVELLGR
ncbi:CinA family protein [Variovorax sp. H27-G14]|uniref:CinA family protein n=1 Tax=Variovorax sp. H27-G14 TaxID=3111914 RepID=UPI0038FC873B